MTEEERELKKFTEDYPQSGSGYHRLGDYYKNQGRLEEAETILRKVQKAHPDEPYYLNALGYCLSLQGTFTEADPLLRKAVELDSNDSEYQLDLAYHLVLQEEYGEAEIICLSVAEQEPDSIRCSEILSLAHEEDYPNQALLYAQECLKKARREGLTQRVVDAQMQIHYIKETLGLYEQDDDEPPNLGKRPFDIP